jgi:hypothetical protein
MSSVVCTACFLLLRFSEENYLTIRQGFSIVNCERHATEVWHTACSHTGGLVDLMVI